MVDVKFAWILICTLISNSAYALIAPFLPIEFKEKGVSGEMIGIIFALYSVAVIICSPFVGKTLVYCGNSNMIALGIATMGTAFICFGFVEQLDSMVYILTVGCILRFVQGAASAFVQTTCYSIAVNEFPERKEEVVGWVEAMTGVGLISGPIIGSSLYSILGYANTFFIYGSILILAALLIKLKFPTGEQKVTLLSTNDDDFFESVDSGKDSNEVINEDLGSFKQDD